MNNLLGPHPAVCAFLLCGGACLTAFGVYVFVHESPASGSAANAMLGVLADVITVALGFILWLGGCVAYGRMYGVRTGLALALGLLTLPGLVAIRLVGRRLTPHEAWRRSNPEMTDEKTARRSYRDIKPLY